MSAASRRLALGNSGRLLYRILDQPNLVAAVQALPAPALGKLINHVGLEDAGELVALATTSQLVGIFDDELWQSPAPGKDEIFDADRFALWLEVMLEAGEEFAASKLAELPEDLVTLAFHKHLLVINIEELAISMSSRASENPADDDLQLEKALESCLCEELGEFRIIARHQERWDTLFGLLVALDRDHHEFLERLLARLCAIDEELIEDRCGLYRVLSDAESLESDVAGDREDRRAEEGFIAPSSAAAFLALARTSDVHTLLSSEKRDPVTAAYFRNLQSRAQASGDADSHSVAKGTSDTTTSQTRQRDALLSLLCEAEVLAPPRSGLLLDAPSKDDGAQPTFRLTRFTLALRQLAETTPAVHAERVRELAYVTNVLVAGCSLGGRPMRPIEAGHAAVATCNLGLDRLTEGKDPSADEILGHTTADKLFSIGWNLLFHQGVVPAANTGVALLGKLTVEARHPATKRDLDRAIDRLRSAIRAEKPWMARQSLIALDEHLPPSTSAALRALLDECPTLAGRLASAGGNEPELIATGRQLRAAHRFLDDLAAS